MFRWSVSSSALLLMVSLCFSARAEAATVITSIMLDDVQVRPGVTSDIHLVVHERAGAPCEAATVLLIHGGMANGAYLAGLADALLEDEQHDRPVCRAITLDLPGHGDSSLPDGAFLGDLTFDDYAGTVLSVMSELRKLGIRPWTLVGHSMGGGIIMRMQQRLLDSGSSLKAIGVRHAILLAPAIPSGSPWAIRDLGIAAALFGPFHVSDPVLGDVISVPPAYWVPLFFSLPDGTTLVGAPTMEELMALDAVEPESYTLMAGAIGIGDGPPLTVAAGAFSSAKGTRLDVVAFGLDTLVWPSDATSLFSYLTAGQTAKAGLTLVNTSGALHVMPFTNPRGLVELLADDVSLP